MTLNYTKAKMRLQKNLDDKHTDAKDAEDAQDAGAPGSPLKAPLTPDQKTFVCPVCEQKIPLLSRDEHEDWHFAKDLQEQDGTSTQAAPAQISSLPQKKDLAANGHHTEDQPPQYAPPAHPPPRSGANNGATRNRPHTNQVIEVARLRARDEVRIQPPVMYS